MAPGKRRSGTENLVTSGDARCCLIEKWINMIKIGQQMSTTILELGLNFCLKFGDLFGWQLDLTTIFEIWNWDLSFKNFYNMFLATWKTMLDLDQFGLSFQQYVAPAEAPCSVRLAQCIKPSVVGFCTGRTVVPLCCCHARKSSGSVN